MAKDKGLSIDSKELQEFLERAAAIGDPSVFRALTERAMEVGGAKAIQLINADPGFYPANRPQPSGYVRTGTLGKSVTWEVQQTGREGWALVIGSNVDYAPFVIGGEDLQAWMHIGWWTPLEGMIVEGLDEILTVVTDEYGEALDAYLEAF